MNILLWNFAHLHVLLTWKDHVISVAGRELGIVLVTICIKVRLSITHEPILSAISSMMISNKHFFLVPLMSEALSSFDDLDGLLICSSCSMLNSMESSQHVTMLIIWMRQIREWDFCYELYVCISKVVMGLSTLYSTSVKKMETSQRWA